MVEVTKNIGVLTGDLNVKESDLCVKLLVKLHLVMNHLRTMKKFIRGKDERSE